MIKSEKEYNEKLERFEIIFFAESGTKEGDEAEKLAGELESYETIHYPTPEVSDEDIEEFKVD